MAMVPRPNNKRGAGGGALMSPEEAAAVRARLQALQEQQHQLQQQLQLHEPAPPPVLAPPPAEPLQAEEFIALPRQRDVDVAAAERALNRRATAMALNLLAAPIMYSLFGPDCEWFMGPPKQARPPPPPGFKRGARLVTVKCLHCEKSIDIDKESYDKRYSDFRVCSVTCREPKAVHRECAFNHMRSKRKTVYENDCDNPQCLQRIKFEAEDGAQSYEVGGLLNRLFWWLFFRHFVLGLIILYGTYWMLYLSLQYDCWKEDGAPCLPHQIMLPTINELFWNHPFVRHRRWLGVLFAWFLGVILFAFKQALFGACGWCCGCCWNNTYNLYWSIRYKRKVK